MSWAAHNPESYSEVLRNGVQDKLRQAMKANGFDDYDEDTLSMIVQVLQDDFPKAMDALESISLKEINDAESDFLTRGVE
jgi:hypothetical protein